MSVFSWYSSTLLSGRSRAILQGLSYCLKDIMCAFPSRLALGIHLTGMRWSAPLLWLLGCQRCDAWSEVLLQRPGLSKGPAVKTENQIHNFLVFDNPPPPHLTPPSHPIPSHHRTARALSAFQGYKCSDATDNLRWSPLIGCVFTFPTTGNSDLFKEIKAKNLSPSVCFVSACSSTAAHRGAHSLTGRSQTWTPPVGVHVCSVYRNIRIYQQLSALSWGILDVQRLAVCYKQAFLSFFPSPGMEHDVQEKWRPWPTMASAELVWLTMPWLEVTSI